MASKYDDTGFPDAHYLQGGGFPSYFHNTPNSHNPASLSRLSLHQAPSLPLQTPSLSIHQASLTAFSPAHRHFAINRCHQRLWFSFFGSHLSLSSPACSLSFHPRAFRRPTNLAKVYRRVTGNSHYLPTPSSSTSPSHSPTTNAPPSTSQSRQGLLGSSQLLSPITHH